MQNTFRSTQRKHKSYNQVVLPGKWNVRDAVPETCKYKKDRMKQQKQVTDLEGHYNILRD